MVYDGIHDGELSPREFFTRLFAEADARDSRPLEEREYGRREFFAHLFGEGGNRSRCAAHGGHGEGLRSGATAASEASGGWGRCGSRSRPMPTGSLRASASMWADR